jgi:hypothetical protein
VRVVATSDCHNEFEELRDHGVAFGTPDVVEQPVANIAVLEELGGNRLMLREKRQSSRSGVVSTTVLITKPPNRLSTAKGEKSRSVQDRLRFCTQVLCDVLL